LRAAPLEDRTLVEALEELVQDKPGLPNVEVTLAIIGGGRPLPLRIEVGIYRIVQEALSNVGQHAGASQVKVILETTPVQVRLEVEDDGRGFDPRKVTGNRYGLIGLNERAKLLGGQMQLESGEGKGTRLEILVPLSD
jgi:two-component system NarL family sensor kinase